MSNKWGGFQKSPIGAPGGHTVIAGREQLEARSEISAQQVSTPTSTASTGIFIPYEEKDKRIEYLQNTLTVLQNLALTVEAQLQQEMES